MQALWKPTPGGGMRLTQALPEGHSKPIPDEHVPKGAITNASRQIDWQYSENGHGKPVTKSHIE